MKDCRSKNEGSNNAKMHLTLLLFVLAFLFSLDLVYSQSNEIIYSNSTSNPPTIDGVYNETEWANATLVNILLKTLTEEHNATLGVLNTGTDLFFLVIVYNLTYNVTLDCKYELRIEFHANNTGYNNSFADWKEIDTNSTYGDYYTYNTTYSFHDGSSQQHGAGEWSHEPGHGYGNYTFEFRISLSSGDPLDLNVTADDTIWFQIHLLVGNLTTGSYIGHWPDYMYPFDEYSTLYITRRTNVEISDLNINTTVWKKGIGVTVQARIDNTGNTRIEDLSCTFYLTNGTVSVMLRNATLDLDLGESRTESFELLITEDLIDNWTAAGLDFGNLTIFAVINEGSTIEEESETDNIVFSTFNLEETEESKGLTTVHWALIISAVAFFLFLLGGFVKYSIRKTVGDGSKTQIVIEEPITFSMEQIQTITPVRGEMLKLMYENYSNRAEKPYTTQKELADQLGITPQAVMRHITELEESNLIKKVSLSEIRTEHRYSYDSRTQYLYYVDKPLHDLKEKGRFIPTYLDDK